MSLLYKKKKQNKTNLVFGVSLTLDPFIYIVYKYAKKHGMQLDIIGILLTSCDSLCKKMKLYMPLGF